MQTMKERKGLESILVGLAAKPKHSLIAEKVQPLEKKLKEKK